MPLKDRQHRPDTAFDYRPGVASVGPAVSIVTALANGEPIAPETIRTVLGQSFQNWEWLIIGDAACAPRLERALAVAPGPDPRVKLIPHAEPAAFAAAVNAGFRAATAEFVLLAQSGAALEPTALERWLWILLSRPDLAVAGSDPKSSFLIRKSAFDQAGGFDPRSTPGSAVADFLGRCARAGLSTATVPDGCERGAGTGPAGTSAAGLRANEEIADSIPSNPLRKDSRRILFVFPWLVMGGADKFNLRMIEALTGRGWDVSIATTIATDHVWFTEFRGLTPDIFILDRFLRLPDYPRFLRYLILSRGTDLVCISNSRLAYQLLPYLRAHCPGVAFVDYNHMEEEYWENGGHPRSAVTFSECLDRHFVSSRHLKDWMVMRGVDRDRIEIVYTNEDVDLWRPDAEVRARVRAELDIESGTPVILYSARICRQKRPAVLAEVMRRLHAGNFRFVTLVAGDGPDFGELRRSIRAHRLERQVRLLGAVANERVNALMKASDIFFLPSDWEGIALTLYEAMASGLAVLSTDVGGQHELVTEDCGTLVAKGDDETETARYVAVLTDWLTDVGRIGEMRRRARQRIVEHFRSEAMAERLHGLLCETGDWPRTRPRPPVGEGLGRACAIRAVEHARIDALALALMQQIGIGGPGAGSQAPEQFFPIARGILRILFKLERTRFGKWFFYNRTLQRVGKAVLGRPPGP